MTAQSMVIAKHSETNKTKNSANAFKWAIWLFLESLVGLKCIGNQVIHQLHDWRRSQQWCLIVILNIAVTNCFYTWCRIIFAMHTQLLWTPWELVEQLFLAQPKAHQAKYAKISEMSSNVMTSSEPSAKLRTSPLACFKNLDKYCCKLYVQKGQSDCMT